MKLLLMLCNKVFNRSSLALVTSSLDPCLCCTRSKMDAALDTSFC